MPDEYSQIDMKKMLAASLSQEAKRIVEGLLDGSIVLDVPTALEIVRNHVYSPPVKEYLTLLTLRFDSDFAYTFVQIPGEHRMARLSIEISKSKFYRDELVRHIITQSTLIWTETFRDSVALASAASINKQPDSRSRRKIKAEDLLR